jgi:glycosyltransferase involved in cell wall biosynthesis
MSEPTRPSPTISVVMPVYNAQRYLHQAIDSILSQTFSDFEFICVDDGCTDGSPQILKEYCQRDSRVVIITRANGGVTSALNAGLAGARGQYIARMDADDVAEPSRFERQLEYMNNHPECAAVGCWVIHIDDNGAEEQRSERHPTHELITGCLWEGNAGALPHFGAFIRRNLLTQIGNYREQFPTAQDLDLFLRLAEIGKLANIPEFLMRYREHEGSVGASRAKQQARNAREVLRQAYERRGMELPDRLARWENVYVTVNQSRWVWRALEEGRYGDARRHAWGVLRSKPGRGNSWRLAFHAALGPARPYLRSALRALRILGR